MAIATSELAVNIAKYGVRGEITLDGSSTPSAGGGIVIVASDCGPPFHDFEHGPARRLRRRGPHLDPLDEGRHGLGTGLGAVARFTDELGWEPTAGGKRIRAVRYKKRPRPGKLTSPDRRDTIAAMRIRRAAHSGRAGHVRRPRGARAPVAAQPEVSRAPSRASGAFTQGVREARRKAGQPRQGREEGRQAPRTPARPASPASPTRPPVASSPGPEPRRRSESPELRAMRELDRALFPCGRPPPARRGSPRARRSSIAASPRCIASGMPPGAQRSPPPRRPSRRAISSWLRQLTMPDIPVRWDARVVRYLEFYKSNPRGRSMVAGWLKKSGRYGGAIRRILRENGLPEDIVWLALVESGFDPTISSPAGAAGPLAVHARGRAHLRARRRPLDRRAPRPRAIHRRRRPLPRRPAHPLRELGAGVRRLQHGLRRPARVDPQVQHQRLLGALPPRSRACRWRRRSTCPRSWPWPSSPGTARRSASTTSSWIPRCRSTRSRCAPGVSLQSVALAAGTSTDKVAELNPQLTASRAPPSDRPGAAKGDADAGPVRVPAGAARPRPRKSLAQVRRGRGQGGALRRALGRVARRHRRAPPHHARHAGEPQRSAPRRVAAPRHGAPRPRPPRRRGPPTPSPSRAPGQARGGGPRRDVRAPAGRTPRLLPRRPRRHPPRRGRRLRRHAPTSSAAGTPSTRARRSTTGWRSRSIAPRPLARRRARARREGRPRPRRGLARVLRPLRGPARPHARSSSSPSTGDTWRPIAHKYGLSVAQLERINGRGAHRRRSTRATSSWSTCPTARGPPRRRAPAAKPGKQPAPPAEDKAPEAVAMTRPHEPAADDADARDDTMKPGSPTTPVVVPVALKSTPANR